MYWCYNNILGLLWYVNHIHHGKHCQIRAWDINYWNKSFKETEEKGYPPRIRLQLYTGLEDTFPIEFTGCTSDSNLYYELPLISGASK